jgi:hypothetical protein
MALKLLQMFLDAVFLLVPMESLVDEEEVLSRQTGRTPEKGYKFLSDRWIALNVLHEVSDAVVVVVPMESLVVEEYSFSRQTATTAKKGYNF